MEKTNKIQEIINKVAGSKISANAVEVVFKNSVKISEYLKCSRARLSRKHDGTPKVELLSYFMDGSPAFIENFDNISGIVRARLTTEIYNAFVK